MSHTFGKILESFWRWWYFSPGAAKANFWLRKLINSVMPQVLFFGDKSYAYKAIRLPWPISKTIRIYRRFGLAWSTFKVYRNLRPDVDSRKLAWKAFWNGI